MHSSFQLYRWNSVPIRGLLRFTPITYVVAAKNIWFKCCVHLLHQQVQLRSPMFTLVLVLAPFIWMLLTALAVRVTSLTVSVASSSVVLVILKMLESDVKVNYTWTPPLLHTLHVQSFDHPPRFNHYFSSHLMWYSYYWELNFKCCT